MTAGRLDDDLLLVRWTGEGDTVWTRRAPLTGSGDRPWTMNQLSSGDLMITTSLQTVFYDTEGTALGGIDLPGYAAIELGTDSLLALDYSGNIRLTDMSGNIRWERTAVTPLGHFITSPAVAPLNNGFVVAAGNTADFLFQTRVQMTRYANDGSFVDSLTLHWDAGSIVAGRAAVPCMDGGALLAWIHGTGNTVLARVDAVGDTLWTRMFGMNGDLPGYPDFFDVHDATEMSDGRFVLSGVGGVLGKNSFELALLELDANGSPLCFEVVNEQGFPPDTRLVRDALDRIHLSVAERTDLAPVGQTMIGFDDLCLNTGVADPRTLPPFDVQPRITERCVRVVRGQLAGDVVLLDVLGRPVLRASVSQSELDLSGLPIGTYFVQLQGQNGTIPIVRR